MIQRYECVSTFYVPLIDEHEMEVENEEVEIEKGSLWEREEKAWMSDVRLTNESDWLEITEENLEAYFTELKGADE